MCPVDLGAAGRVRMMLQSAVLAIGAYLVIQQEASADHRQLDFDGSAPRRRSRHCKLALCRVASGVAQTATVLAAILVAAAAPAALASL